MKNSVFFNPWPDNPMALYKANNVGTRIGYLVPCANAENDNGSDMHYISVTEDQMKYLEKMQIEIKSRELIDSFFGKIFYNPVVFKFEVDESMVIANLLNGNAYFESNNYGDNYSVVLCKEGIAVGRLPKINIEKAITHRNRVKLLPWSQYSEALNPITGSSIDYSFPPLPTLDSKATEARSALERVLNGNGFTPFIMGAPDDSPWEASEEVSSDSHSEVSVETSATDPSVASKEAFDVEEPSNNEDCGNSVFKPSDEDPQDGVVPVKVETVLAGSTKFLPAVFDFDPRIMGIEKMVLAMRGVNMEMLEFQRRERTLLGLDTYDDLSTPLQREGPTSGEQFLPPEVLASEAMNAFNSSIETFEARITEFLFNPEEGLSLPKNISFSDLVRFIVSGLGNQSGQASTYSFFKSKVSASDICWARGKIKNEGFKFFFDTFIDNLNQSSILKSFWKRYKGFRLFGCDGTMKNVPLNTSDKDSLCNPARKNGRPFNQFNCTVLYDILNKYFVDYRLVGRKKTNERAALLDMVDQLQDKYGPVLVIGDRGFESWEVFARLYDKKVPFLIRIKDKDSNGILSSFSVSKKEFHGYMDVTLCRSLPSKEEREPGRDYKKSTCPFVKEKEHDEIRLRLRVLQFRLPSGKIETLITNVPSWVFTCEDLIQLYRLRWNTEVGFRILKYYQDAAFYHSYETNRVCQEIHGKMILSSFSSFIICNTQVPPPRRKKERKYEYAINRSHGSQLCLELLKGFITVQELASGIVRNIQPIRPGRSFPRNVRPQSAKGFRYRGFA